MNVIAQMQGEVGLNPSPFLQPLGRMRTEWQQFLSGMEKKGVLDPVEAAFKQLGVTSQASLNKAANEAIHSFERIRTSGAATAGDIDGAP